VSDRIDSPVAVGTAGMAVPYTYSSKVETRALGPAGFVAVVRRDWIVAAVEMEATSTKTFVRGWSAFVNMGTQSGYWTWA
jgi:hypothetical protein